MYCWPEQDCKDRQRDAIVWARIVYQHATNEDSEEVALGVLRPGRPNSLTSFNTIP